MLSKVSLFIVSVLFAHPVFAKDMTFDVIYMNHTNIIVADGDITNDTPERFQEFLDSDQLDGFRFIIHLNSDGGSLFGGVKFGKMIRAGGFSTEIMSYKARADGEEYWRPREQAGRCMSACALAFLGGERRIIEDNSIIGFHQFSGQTKPLGQENTIAKTQANTQIVSSLVLDYIVTMGGHLELFQAMSLALPDDLFVPNKTEQRRLRIVSQTTFNEFGFEPYLDGVVAFSVFPENVEGRQIVYQVTTYCKSGVPYLLLSGPPNFDGLSPSWIASAKKEHEGFNIGSNDNGPSIKYGPERVKFSADSAVLMEVRIDNHGVKMLTSGTAWGSLSLAGVHGYFFGFTIDSTQEDKDKITTSFRLCIS